MMIISSFSQTFVANANIIGNKLTAFVGADGNLNKNNFPYAYGLQSMVGISGLIFATPGCTTSMVG